MKLSKSDHITRFIRSYIESAALGTALELGLFWLLDKQPQSGLAIAQMLEIPPIRCKYWLELLCSLDLIDRVGDEYKPSSTAYHAIIDSYGQDTWKLLAGEARERFRSVSDLALHIKEPGSVWSVTGFEPPDYVAQMKRNANRARHFTRMLYEIHQPLAEELAQTLNMAGVKHMMDLGGGSGVISLALLRRHPELMSMVVDLANVCAAGREIAMENSMGERLIFHVGDMLEDELPTGFDLVLECDIGIYEEALFRKLRTSLNERGRFAIIDHLSISEGIEPPSQLGYAFQSSLADPSFALPTVNEIEVMLNRVGFQVTDLQRLSNGMDLIVSERN